MIKRVTSSTDCKICDNFLTLLIQDERKYANDIDENFVVKDYFINVLNKDNILLLDKDKNVPTGYIFALKKENGYLIDGLYVDVNYRKKGLATKLIKEIVLNINYPIFLWVYKNNIKALNLYKKLGFIIKNETPEKYFMEYLGNK